jgi:putative FmdB family regulatory protein
MPLYEYECTTCHKRTEKIQKFSDPEITVCPHCSGHLERVLSAPAIAFKGGGWFADGYGNAKSKATGDSASNGASSSDSKSSNGASSSDSNSSSSDTKSSNGGSASTTSTPAPAAAPAPASSSSDKK